MIATLVAGTRLVEHAKPEKRNMLGLVGVFVKLTDHAKRGQTVPCGTSF